MSNLNTHQIEEEITVLAIKEPTITSMFVRKYFGNRIPKQQIYNRIASMVRFHQLNLIENNWCPYGTKKNICKMNFYALPDIFSVSYQINLKTEPKEAFIERLSKDINSSISCENESLMLDSLSREQASVIEHYIDTYPCYFSGIERFFNYN